MRGTVAFILGLLLAVGIVIALNASSESKVDLNEKFSLTGEVIEFGKYNEPSYEEVLQKFQEYYLENLDKNKKVYFVFGNEQQIELSTYEEMTRGNVNLNVGGEQQRYFVKENEYAVSKIFPKEDKLVITINTKEYSFKLKEDENVYFIISEDGVLE